MTKVVLFKEKQESFRLRHKTLKGVMLLVRDRSRPLSNAGKGLRPVCKVCTVEHIYKTYHLQLDSEGCILVSQGIYDNLVKMIDKAGFDIADVIHDPPAQTIAVETVDMRAKAYDPGSLDQKEKVHADGTKR